MTRMLALVAVMTLAACGTTIEPAVPDIVHEVDGIPISEPQAGETAENGGVTDTSIDHGGAAGPVAEAAAESKTTAATMPPVAASPSTTTTSTVPDLDLDLSDLDTLVNELDGLLGSLGAAMNQTEGEFTP